MIGWLGGFCGHDSATDQASDMRVSLQQILVLLMLIWNLNVFPVILYISSFLSLSSD